MKTLKRMLAALMALTMMGALGACGGSDSSKSASSSEAESAYKEKDDVAVDASLVDDMVKDDPDIKGQTIYWLADYDINPKNNQDRSVALSLFEDKYGAKVEYVSCTSDTKFDTLASPFWAVTRWICSRMSGMLCRTASPRSSISRWTTIWI